MSERLLILGGTAEARALARLAAERFGARLAVTTSLAGRTARPAAVEGEVRAGGFGGATGLADYLRRARVDLVVDATHPFAARISASARAAAEAAGVARLLLVRPPWQRHPEDRWIEVDDAGQAAAALAALARRVWLTIGARQLKAFAGLDDQWFLVRTIDPRRSLPLANFELILGRGPFTLEGERRVLADYRIEAVVTKASGGDATAAKLVAARQAGLPVVMIRRPPPEPGPAVFDCQAALEWIAARLKP
ncbi:MAG: cobalt-precorrin-6A reductase [Pseudomonadota bacterium]